MPTLHNSMKPPTFLLSFSHSLNDSFCAKPRKSPFPLLPHTTSKEERRKKLWDLPIQSIAQATTDLLTEEVIFFCEVAAVLWAITIDISGKGISRETADRSNSAWKSKGIRLWRKKNFLSIPRNLIWVFRKLRNWGKAQSWEATYLRSYLGSYCGSYDDFMKIAPGAKKPFSPWE